MAGVMRLVEQVAISKLMASSTPSNQTNTVTQIMIMMCGLLASTGFGFILYGSYLWLLGRYAQDVAALITGAVAFLLMLIVIAGLFAYEIARLQKIKMVKRAMISKVEKVMNDMDDEIGGPIRDHPKTAVAVSTLAGFLVGERL